MDDKQQAILALLKDLRRQVAETPRLEAEVAQQVHSLMQDIEDALPGGGAADTEPAATAEGPLAERLKQATLDFEATYPTLSRTVGNIADTLAQIGI